MLGPLLGRGRVADVHAWGEHAIKLYHPGCGKTAAFVEAAMLAVVEDHALPVPRVHGAGNYDGRWGLVMDRVEGETLGAWAMADASRSGTAFDEMVRLQLLVHSKRETRLRPLKGRLADSIGRAAAIEYVLKRMLLERLDTMPDGDRLCHGDFHPFNIIGRGAGAKIVDWLDTTRGSPAADACRSYLLLRQGAAQFAAAYLDRYAAAAGIARADILAWLPVVAAARLAEGIAEEEASLVAMAQGVR